MIEPEVCAERRSRSEGPPLCGAGLSADGVPVKKCEDAL